MRALLVLLSTTVAAETLLPAEAHAMPNGRPAALRVEMDREFASVVPGDGEVIAYRYRGAEGAPEELGRFPVKVPGDSLVSVPVSDTYLFRLESKGFIAPDVILTPSGADSLPVRLTTFPTAFIQARLATPVEELIGRQVNVRMTRLSASPGAGSPELTRPSAPPEPLFERRCQLNENLLSCEVPAGRWDMRFRIPGFIPVYQWGVSIAASRKQSIPPLAFRRGSSVVGRVEALRGRLTRDCVAILSAAANGGRLDGPQGRRLERARRSARVNDRGFFQFADVPPGFYDVVVSQPGLAPGRVSMVEVREGLESEITRPLVLSAPLSVTVDVEPKAQSEGSAWVVHLLAPNSASEAGTGEFRSVVDKDTGRASIDGLSAGNYRLTVSGDEESIWWSEDVELSTPGTRFSVSIPSVEVEGTVTVGEDPLSATLWFGGRRGRRRVRLSTDEQGRFSGRLPEVRAWSIDVIDGAGLTVTLLSVPMEVVGPGRARVDVRVPDITVDGNVVDEEGRPVQGARVRATGESIAKAESEADGRFRLRGLQGGMISLLAEKGSSASEPVSLVLGDAGAPTQTLVLRRPTEVEGVVQLGSTPVAGARVVAWSPAGGRIAETVTGPDGEFSLSGAGGARTLDFVVVGAGLPISSGRVQVPDDGRVSVILEGVGGWVALPPMGRSPLVFHHNQAVVPVPLLLRLAGVRPAPGASAELHLESGTYELCNPATSEPCVTGVVLPGTRVSLNPPKPPNAGAPGSR
ncbi:MAG: carboxypeptidase regulatory-like domain-containing protein [Thermoanaerobaculia bacterium]|nr:carboxypeptidase regulatory-like domain-containing protein [Thermoanaerobaculia bacterium]